MNCTNTIIILVILLLVLSMKNTEMFSFEESTPMKGYFPSKDLSYTGSLEPMCDNGYGYYNLGETKKVNGKNINAKVMFNYEHYDAMCSPYVLKPELMVCSVYNKKNTLEFYGFMPKKC
jgi:hypothetical protein